MTGEMADYELRRGFAQKNGKGRATQRGWFVMTRNM